MTIFLNTLWISRIWSFQRIKCVLEPVFFCLSQMGELCKSVSDDFKHEHSDLPWHELYGLRNRIVHDYDGVNLKLIWQIIREDLPELKSKIEALLDKSKS